MKKAFLYAYDKVNLGDDLFIRTIVERYPYVKFYFWSNKENQKIFREHKNLKVVNQNTLFLNLIRKIRPSLVVRYQENVKNKCDALIYIGGSIFMEYPSWRNIVNWWNYQVEKHPFYIVGANFGPYQTEEYRAEMQKVFLNMRDVCFRDRYSLQLFEDSSRIRYAPDILFSYPIPEASVKSNTVFMSVINCETKEEGKYKEYKETYEKTIFDIAVQFIKQGKNVVFASFCKEEGDEEAICRIKDKLSQCGYEKRIDCIFYSGTNSQELLQKISVAEYVVASRFHAIILGLVAGKVVYPIIYSDKGKHVLKDIDFAGKMLDLRHLEEFHVENFLKEISNQETCNVSHIINQSEKHFECLDKVLAIKRCEV